MDYKIKVIFYDDDSVRTYSCFITLSDVLYFRHFLYGDPISYETLSTLVSPRTLQRIKPLFFTEVAHSSNGSFVVTPFYRYRVLSVKSV